MFRYGSEADSPPHKDYKSGGFLLVARGRTLETFKFRRAPGGGGRLIGWNATLKKSIVLPTDGKTGNRDKAAIVAAAQDSSDPLALERARQTEVREVLMIHVGGTRCVPSSTDHTLKILARITWTVEVIRTCICLFLLDV